MYRSLFTLFAFFLPFPGRHLSVHISFTSCNTMLQWRSKAFMRPKSFLLLRQLINTCVLFLIDFVRIERGPVLNSSFSRACRSSAVICDFGLIKAILLYQCSKRFKISLSILRLSFCAYILATWLPPSVVRYQKVTPHSSDAIYCPIGPETRAVTFIDISNNGIRQRIYRRISIICYEQRQ